MSNHMKIISALIIMILVSPLISGSAAQILFDINQDVWGVYVDFALFISDIFNGV